jgi:hypothetical protein
MPMIRIWKGEVWMQSWNKKGRNKENFGSV